MPGRLTAFSLVCLMTTGASAADLAVGSGHSIRLADFNGTVYYTVGEDGYRVVATLAAGVEGLPIRFISTLHAGQRVVISVPQSVGQPSIDFEIMRNGDVLVVSEPLSVAAVDRTDDLVAPAALVK